MGHIEATRELAASPEALWDIISNPNTWGGQWFTVHDKWLDEPPATLTAGARLTAKIVMLNMANKIEWAVKSVDAPTSLALGGGTGMAGVKADFRFTIEPVGTGSRFTVSGGLRRCPGQGCAGQGRREGRRQAVGQDTGQARRVGSAAV